MKKIIFTLHCLLFLIVTSYAQCNLIVSDTEICGGQSLSAYFESTSNNYDYRVVISSSPNAPISGSELGDSINIVPPITDFESSLS
ncbi:MAG: hypothetical protein R2728_09410 [Chitinophagales bacterium]